MRAEKPFEQRPILGVLSRGSEESQCRHLWKSMNVKGGLDQLVKRLTKASSVKNSLSVIRSLLSCRQFLWTASRTLSSIW